MAMNKNQEPKMQGKRIRERTFLPGFRGKAKTAANEPKSKLSSAMTRLRKRAKHMRTWQ